MNCPKCGGKGESRRHSSVLVCRACGFNYFPPHPNVNIYCPASNAVHPAIGPCPAMRSCDKQIVVDGVGTCPRCGGPVVVHDLRWPCSIHCHQCHEEFWKSEWKNMIETTAGQSRPK